MNDTVTVEANVSPVLAARIMKFAGVESACGSFDIGRFLSDFLSRWVSTPKSERVKFVATCLSNANRVGI